MEMMPPNTARWSQLNCKRRQFLRNSFQHMRTFADANCSAAALFRSTGRQFGRADFDAEAIPTRRESLPAAVAHL